MSENKERDDFLQQIKKVNSDSSSYILNETKLKQGFKKFTTELKKQKPELSQN